MGSKTESRLVTPALEIARNFPHCDEYSDDSFVGGLHELRTWSVDEYWRYEAALYELARVSGKSPDLSGKSPGGWFASSVMQRCYFVAISISAIGSTSRI